jgi:hypothetical protein
VKEPEGSSRSEEKAKRLLSIRHWGRGDRVPPIQWIEVFCFFFQKKGKRPICAV